MALESTDTSGRSLQLVLHYDGARFAGWQRQRDARTVQGVLEAALERLTRQHVAVLGAGRTDAGVHARGQAAGVRVAERWTAGSLRRALNAVLPDDVWVAAAFEMRDEFHARYSAVARRYTYLVGTDDDAFSPFRRGREFACAARLDRECLDVSAAAIVGEHGFRGFAVKGTAPATDDHHCRVSAAFWRPRDGGLAFVVEANRFLHHMVRFLVGTMLDAASGRREPDAVAALLEAADNRGVSAPAPPHALYLDAVRYPAALYLDAAPNVAPPPSPVFADAA
ncbi:tRNA pseudouridine synthase A [Gemmatimonadetes bacterium T265]|nr:tRNA pseudouridine synthase A [Gemmatimonadetes bacterium T265]